MIPALHHIVCGIARHYTPGRVHQSCTDCAAILPLVIAICSVDRLNRGLPAFRSHPGIRRWRGQVA